MGLLDADTTTQQIPNLDPGLIDQLKQYLALMQPSADAVQQAKKNRLVEFGLGMMTGRKGNELATIGSSGLNAMGNYNKDIAAQQALQGQNITQALGLMQMAKQNQVLQQNSALGGDIGKLFANAGAPPGPQLQNMGPGGPTPANAAAIAPPPQQGGGDNMAQQAAVYRQAAAKYAAAGPQFASQAKTLSDIANQMEEQLKYNTTPQVVMDPTTHMPTNVLINSRGGTMPMQYQPKPDYQKVSNGQVESFRDPLTGATSPIGNIAMQMTPGEKASNALGYSNLAESKRYHNLELGMDENGQGTGNIDAVAKAIANYQQPALSSFAMAKPLGAAVMGKVMEINPSYDAKNYATAQQTANAFAKGPLGNTTRSISVALQHMDVLNQANVALQNGNVPLFNKAANFVATQTGAPAPTNFNAVKDIVANEVTKAIIGSGGGVGDRDKAQAVISAANSPQQLQSVLNSYRQLFVGQLNGLEQQYKAGTKLDDFNKFLSLETQALRAQQKIAPNGDIRSQADKILSGQ